MQWQPRNKRSGRKGNHWFRFRGAGKAGALRLALTVVLAGVAVYALVRLIGYGAALLSSRQADQEMRQIYYNASTSAPEVPSVQPSPRYEPSITERLLPTPEANAEQPSSAPSSAMQGASAAPVRVPVMPEDYDPYFRLKNVSYPNGYQVEPRFQALRELNEDIVGWLTVGGMVDEAVVQRDNVFYLDHDVRQKENSNGALFMDAAVNLNYRPYSLVIYGHNMKSGEKFGNLRRYENDSYYRNTPFISFDSIYENGTYVIFSAGKISMTPDMENYVDFFAFTSLRAYERQEMINTLIRASALTCEIDVRAEDQLLVLVTCTESDPVRRVVAARRIRDGESQEQLLAQIANTKTK